MVKLLRSDLRRLFKSVSFWACVFAGFVWGAVKIYNSYKMFIDMGNTSDEGVFWIGGEFSAYPGIPLIIAVLTALFVGTDFSGGTIRNKIAIGHSRKSVCFSYIVACIAGGFAINLAYLVGDYAMGLILGGKTNFYSGFVGELIVTFISYAALCSVLAVLCMLIARRTVGIIAALLTAFFTPMIAESIHNKAAEPEFLVDRRYNKEHTSYTETVEPNPEYISGLMRVICTAADNFLPMGQLEQQSQGHVHTQSQIISYPLYSLGFIAVTSAAGVSVFRRKDLK